MDALVQVVLPVFVVVAVGFVYAGWRRFPIAEVTDFIIYVAGACFVFDALSGARFELSIRVPLTALLITLGCLGLSMAARRLVPPLRALSFGSVVLPVTFMNAGNLGIPVAELAFGQPGLEMAAFYFSVFAVLMYSLGIALVAGSEGAHTVLRIPMVHAAWLGILAHELEFTLPTPLSTPVALLGRVVVPLMLLALGARLRQLFDERKAMRPPVTAVLWLVGLRFGAGCIAALATNAVVGNHGLEAKIALLTGALPPAVMTFALVEKYGGSPRDSAVVAATVAVGTVISLVVLPLAVGMVR
ncbi:MAG: AEC family transporter [Myxococcota bacterium]